MRCFCPILALGLLDAAGRGAPGAVPAGPPRGRHPRAAAHPGRQV